MRTDLRLLMSACAAAALVPSLALAQATASQQAAPSQANTAQPADQAAPSAGRADAAAFEYGPINVEDPEVRAQIKKLYRDQHELEKAAQTHLDELTASFRAETDADLQLQIQREMIQTKKDLQLRSTELGLEIARLNGDAQRVADFERALDRLRNPEQYMPQTVDPEIARERARRMGLEK